MNTDKLKGVIPDFVYADLPIIATTFGINTELRLAHLLAQCKQETNFKSCRENLLYTAGRLREVFPAKFKEDPGLADRIAGNPEATANVVYNLKQLGNDQPGDGYKFRGRGCIGLTGRSNYAAFDKYVPEDIIVNPDLVATKYPFVSAAWYFAHFRIVNIADLGATDDIVERVTKGVNAGLLGLANRKTFFHQFYNLLTK